MSTNILQIREPSFYHREYDNDVKHLKPKNSIIQQAQRISIIALPFLSLYKPLGFAISIVMNATRSFSCLNQLRDAIIRGERKDIGIGLLQSCLAILGIAGSIFYNVYGMMITTGQDVLINFNELLQFLHYGEYEQALDKFLSLTCNSLYLTTFVYGTLEIVILSLAVQIIVEAFKSQALFRKFKNNGNFLDLIEGFAHLAMGGIRGNQLATQIRTLQFKWNLEKILKSTTKMQNVENSKNFVEQSNKELTKEKIDQTINLQKNKCITNEKIEDLSVEQVFEKADVAIKKKDLNTFLELEKKCSNWKNLKQEDLGHLTYNLFENCLHRNEVELNKIGIQMLESLIINHPNADTSVPKLTSILKDASLSGNFAVFEMLKQKHPKWKDLDPTNLYEILEETIESSVGGYSRKEDFEQRKNEGKDNIFFSLIKHEHWDNESSYWTCELLKLSVNRRLIAEIKDTKGFREMNAQMLTSILSKKGINDYSEEFYQICMNHRSWKDLNEKMLKKIACNLLEKNWINPDEIDKGFIKIRLFDLLIQDERWTRLETRDLVDVAEAARSSRCGEYSYEFISKLSQHSKWNDLSADELFFLIEPPLNFSDMQIYRLLMKHPNWNYINKSDMADLASCAANQDKIDLLEIISLHPTWKNFTEHDLFDIVEWSYWQEDLSKIIAIISTHEKWPNIEQKVQQFLKQKNIDL